jgi:rhamnose utilization protein RhaD (predicted bifunctional aldolase and dehydrogenase)/NAD(P)-dependent dehydrogenase (short-subunit alcohol dehydrogenase family)
MRNLWNEGEANKIKNDLLQMRVYTSKLLGQEEDLVMHGGGNTSVKITEKNIFGEEEKILYVKGSGWDLATIEAPGFAPVKLSALTKLAELSALSDLDMVKYQRMAMINPSAPNPSVEAILHAIIPFDFVDHTHADAVVTMTNTTNGKAKIKEAFGERVLIIPYVMPGFILAKKIFEMTKGLDWQSIDGMILLNHGVFTFHDDPKVSYDRMIEIVSTAEKYLKQQGIKAIKGQKGNNPEPEMIAQIRKSVSEVWGKPILSRLTNTREAVAFSALPKVKSISNRGPLTPDHIIRTKRSPVVLSQNFEKDLNRYVDQYHQYFKKHHTPGQQELDRAPRCAILPGVGTLAFGPSMKHVQIIEDISRHTRKAIYQAEQLGGWKALPKAALFEMEYWSLEQAKLKKAGSTKRMQGRIALVTGAASGIGRACVMQLLDQGAVITALDINPDVLTSFSQKEVLAIKCDVTSKAQMKKAIEKTVTTFGGLDMLISNAGIFPPSEKIENMDANVWEKSLNINVTSHQQLIKLSVPYLALGFDPAIVIVGSKNVPAPGPGASAYSVAKAGLTQLARVAALELGEKGIRVNVLHPNAVFDTGVWSSQILEARAEHYGMTVSDYKTNNVLKTEVTSKDVAQLAVTMLGSVFSKVTGAQVPIDGGNDRVI